MKTKVFKFTERQFKPGKAHGPFAVGQDRIGQEAGAKHLGFRWQKLAPGFFTLPYHAHETEEEGFLIFSGRALLRTKEGVLPMEPGDLAYCPAEPTEPHQFYNPGPGDCIYLAFSNLAEFERGHYPDSGKVIDFRRQRGPEGQAGGFEMVKPVDYWQGEDDPARHWPPGLLDWPES